MATDSEWYSGDYWINWETPEPPYGPQPPSGEQDSFDIRISDGGVLYLRPKGGDNVLAFAPHLYAYVDFRNISAAESGKDNFT
jgi:hypothetical protein